MLPSSIFGISPSMLGAVYVATALLVAASSQSTATSEQSKVERAFDHDVVAPGEMSTETRSTSFLRASRALQDYLLLSAADEERMSGSGILKWAEEQNRLAAPEATRLGVKAAAEAAAEAAARSAAKAERAAAKTAAKAAKAERAAAKAAKDERAAAKATAKAKLAAAKLKAKAERTAAKAAAKAERAAVKLKAKAERTAAKAIAKAERLAAKAAAKSEPIAAKATAKAKRAALKEAKAKRLASGFSLSEFLADTLQSKLEKEDKPEIVVNAANFLAKRYPPSPQDVPAIIAAASQSSSSNLYRKPSILKDVHLAEQRRKRKATNELSLSLDDQSGHISKKQKLAEENHTQRQRTIPVSQFEAVKYVSERFREDTQLPFELNLEEIFRMLGIVNRIESRPILKHHVRDFERLAKVTKLDDLKTMLGEKGLTILLGNDWKNLQTDKRNLEVAYTLKLIIMYELFYSFCHSSGNLCFSKQPLKELQVEKNYFKSIKDWLPDFRHKSAQTIESAPQRSSSTSQLPHWLREIYSDERQ